MLQKLEQQIRTHTDYQETINQIDPSDPDALKEILAHRSDIELFLLESEISTFPIPDGEENAMKIISRIWKTNFFEHPSLDLFSLNFDITPKPFYTPNQLKEAITKHSINFRLLHLDTGIGIVGQIPPRTNLEEQLSWDFKPAIRAKILKTKPPILDRELLVQLKDLTQIISTLK